VNAIDLVLKVLFTSTLLYGCENSSLRIN